MASGLDSCAKILARRSECQAFMPGLESRAGFLCLVVQRNLAKAWHRAWTLAQKSARRSEIFQAFMPGLESRAFCSGGAANLAKAWHRAWTLAQKLARREIFSSIHAGLRISRGKPAAKSCNASGLTLVQKSWRGAAKFFQAFMPGLESRAGIFVSGGAAKLHGIGLDSRKRIPRGAAKSRLALLAQHFLQTYFGKTVQ